MGDWRPKCDFEIADSFVFNELSFEEDLKIAGVKMVSLHKESIIFAMIRNSFVPVLQGTHEEELRAKECLIGQLANQLAFTIDSH
jgi:hypothetical protein